MLSHFFVLVGIGVAVAFCVSYSPSIDEEQGDQMASWVKPFRYISGASAAALLLLSVALL